MNQLKIELKLFILALVSSCLVILHACNKDTSVESTGGMSPGNYDISVKVDTMTRWFKLVIPPEYNHTERRPLLFCFHGGGLSMDVFFNRRKDLINCCVDENWILVFPNGANSEGNRGDATWNAVHCCPPAFNYNVDDINFVRKMVDTLNTELKIDTTRIYATGCSNGGMLTHRLAADLPDIFAAFAPCAATIGGQVDSLSTVLTVQPTQPIPIIIIHGTDDPAVKYNGGLTRQGSGRIDISFRESVLFWADNNNCALSQADTTITDGLNGKVWIVTFYDADAKESVKAITIENLGHSWPSLENSGFDGTNAIVDFLKQFSK